jgi:hypothetical protein
MELPGLLRFLRDQRAVGIELQGTAGLKAGGQKAEKKKYLHATHHIHAVLLVEEWLSMI